MKKKLIQTFVLVGIVFFIASCSRETIIQTPLDYDVTIYRDIWGVPHIYGERDRDVAFGLAYAHAEDDFGTIQEVLLLSRGKLASVKGKEGAPADYLVGFLKIWKINYHHF